MLGFEVFNPVKLFHFVWAKIPVSQASAGFPNHRFNHVIAGHLKPRDNVIDVPLRSAYFGGELHLGLSTFP